MTKPSNDDEGKQRDQQQADDNAKFFANNCKDEVGMTVGEDTFYSPSPGPRPNQPPDRKESIAVSI